MVGEDRMETPYGYEEYEEYNWKSLVKRIGKYALIVVVIALIGWFLYDYFIGSFVDIQISVKDLEGNPVIDNHVTVKSAGNDVLIFEKSDLSVYRQRLRRGDYSIEVEADGYKPYAVERTFNEDNKSEVIKLKKDMDIKILELNMPEQLFANEQFTLTAKLENKGSKGEEVEFKFGGEFKAYNCRPAEQKMLINSGEIKDFNILCAVPSKTGLEKSTTGKDKEGSVSIKYISESMDKSFTLYPQPRLNISKSVRFTGMNPAVPKDAKKQVDFTIKNYGRFPVQNIRLRIEISSAEKNNPEEVIKWLSFTNSTEPDKRSILIGQIDAREEHREPVELSVPLDAKAETIYGSIVMNAPFLEAPKRISLKIDILKSAQAALSVDYDKSISIHFVNGKPRDEIRTIKIKNTGNLTVENIDLQVQNQDECTENWFAFTSANSIPSLASGASKEVYVTLTTPPLVRVGEYVPCVLWLSYTDPVTSDIVQREVGVMEIKRTR